ncbi:T-cell surface glycoprotein CD1a-like [Pteronotus mesoamericanus]|uniref:T-cell surface glycoprotein CD1a-like n=1 Tax=Pteronotus mesoamericanus TaxID=1884717 RepID=UPI0023EBFB68|nr:T-cell surface glycoprotein CD1a-like [Pteronotus parnellii mesoamericanus]
MLFLLIPLLAVLLAGGHNEEAFQDHIFRAIYSLSLYNHSSIQNWASGWLDELQTFRWKSDSGSTFLQPWFQGNFSHKDVTQPEEAFHRLHAKLLHLLRNHASQWMLEYPFEIQATVGCELHSGEVKIDPCQFAYQGSDLLSFQNTTWVPSPKGGIRAQQMCALLNQYTIINKIKHRIISVDCPRYLLSVLDTGKAVLQRKVKPEAWLSIGPNPDPDHLLLICHVSGFYPKPISVMWMYGEQSEQGSQQSGILPNADGTWYLQIFLDVKATNTSGLSCRVRHSSLEGQDIILYLERPNSKSLVILAVMVPLVLLLTGLAFWLKKRWTHCEFSNFLPLE